MRRRGIVIGLVCAVALAGCDWPTYMYNAAHTGASPDTSIAPADLTAGLTEKWQASLGPSSGAGISGSAVVAKGVVYVATQGGILDAFAADGGTNCTAATPKVCQPLWNSNQLLTGFESTPTVAGGFVYAGGTDGHLYVFDAAGVTNCTPQFHNVCSPLWASSTMGEIESSPVVAGGRVYVGSDEGAVYGFDATGHTGCVNQTCSPVFVGQTGGAVHSSPAVANNVLYVCSDQHSLEAFDALGTKNCSVQHVCLPLWSGPTAGNVRSSPSVAGGRVFVGSDDGKLYAFDAAGKTQCAGAPVGTCQPLWTATTANVVASSPAVAGGVVYIGTIAGGTTGARLDAFDAAGVTNCSGSPKTCQPLWTSATLGTFGLSAITVANGIVYIDIAAGIISFAGSVYAFDATAPSTRCSGTPKVCTPIANLVPTPVDSLGTAPAVADGFVYIAGDQIHAFAK